MVQKCRRQVLTSGLIVIFHTGVRRNSVSL